MAHTGNGLTAGALEFRKESWRGTAGFYRLARTISGAWWLIAPDETPIWWRGVNEVGRGRADEPYAQMVAARFGGEDNASFADEAWRRLTGWGFNAIGPGAAGEFLESGRPHVLTVGFRSTAVPSLRLGGANVPDVFDRRWVDVCQARAAEVAERWRADRDLLGYVPDDGLNWAQLPAATAEGGAPDRPSLLQICLSLEPSMAAYHAAWEFVLAPYGGELAAMAAAWGAELSGRLVLRQWTQEDRALHSPGYRADDERFTREFARRYFGTTAAALREHDSEHLVWGGRFTGIVSTPVLQEAMTATDGLLLAANGAEIEGNSGGLGPWLRDDFAWNLPVFQNHEAAELSGMERMVSGGRAALTKAINHPACVGYNWAAWRAGNAWAVPPWPAGLVFDDDRPVLVHVEPLRSINVRAEAMRVALG